MASAYTPGLTVSAHTEIVKTRRLPLKGEVLVSRGAWVNPETIVAQAALPGILQTVKAAALLGIDPAEVEAALGVSIGDSVTRGQVIARSTALWGLMKSEAKANATGTVELVSKVTGNVGIRLPSTPVSIDAYIPGTVSEVMPGEGVTITATGALVQGIFGVGGERQAPLALGASSPDKVLDASDLTEEHRGRIVVGGSRVTVEALRKAGDVGALGIVAGGIIDTDLKEFLGYDIGVAITGHEELPFSLVLTEGFGEISMARKTYELLAGLIGHSASLCGATQIRAGVIRPEVIVADTADQVVPKQTSADSSEDAFSLEIGVPIRLIREPYFGVLATVHSLPHHLTVIGSGAKVRVLEAKLPDGTIATVPRANVEIVGG
ncbi:MAG: hypothetical protein QM758_16350 [Armatimonas sp.]